jgi:hypothetical protein
LTTPLAERYKFPEINEEFELPAINWLLDGAAFNAAAIN